LALREAKMLTSKTIQM